tara:strand:+ start:363 stop:785 length:423 start_codon:yes stop_codon:yes gene_type:complete
MGVKSAMDAHSRKIEYKMKKIEKAMKNYRVICFGIVLIAALYNMLCIIIYQAVQGLPNAIDDNDGLPLIYDYAMFGSAILVNMMAFASVKAIISWVPPKWKTKWKQKNVKSKWDTSPSVSIPKSKAPGPMPGPPATNNAD